MKQNKGITLIALVITIIIMLILVAVTMATAINGGLFNYAQEASVKTNARIKEEQEYANLGNYEDYGYTKDYEYLIDKYTIQYYVTFCLLDLNDEITASIKIKIPSEEISWDELLNIINDYSEEIILTDGDCYIDLKDCVKDGQNVSSFFIMYSSLNGGGSTLINRDSYDPIENNEPVKSGDLYAFSKRLMPHD